MAIWIVKNSGKISYGIKRYICDTLEDLPYIENNDVVTPGSKAYVISEKKTYMMGSDEEWHEINEGSGGGASSMAQLTDVDLTNLEDGQVLKYDEDTQTWKPADDASATTLGSLDDVNLTDLENGQVIIYNNFTEKWVNADKELLYVDIQAILTAGETSLTVSDNRIASGSTIEIFSEDDVDISYDSITVSTGSVTIVFSAAQSENINLTLRVWIDNTGFVTSGATATDITYNNTQSSLLSSTVQSAIDELVVNKVNVVSGKGLSTEDYTTNEKLKLANTPNYTEISGILTAGSTSLTLQSAAITTNSLVDIYTENYGVSPTNAVVTNGFIELTFEAQQTNMGVKVRVS